MFRALRSTSASGSSAVDSKKKEAAAPVAIVNLVSSYEETQGEGAETMPSKGGLARKRAARASAGGGAAAEGVGGAAVGMVSKGKKRGPQPSRQLTGGDPSRSVARRSNPPLEVVDLTSDTDEGQKEEQMSLGMAEQEEGEEEDDGDELDEDEDDGYVYNYEGEEEELSDEETRYSVETTSGDEERAEGSRRVVPRPPDFRLDTLSALEHSLRANWLGIKISQGFAAASSDLPDLAPLEMEFNALRDSSFTCIMYVEGIQYAIKCIPPSADPSRLDRAVVTSRDPASPFLGTITRLLDAFVPLILESEDEAQLRAGIMKRMQALYVESIALLDKSTSSTASLEEQVADCNAIMALVSPLIRPKNLCKRLLLAIKYFIEKRARWCYVCGRVDDHMARGEAAPSTRPHVCGAELCEHLAAESLDLMAPAHETKLNGGTVTNFLLINISRAVDSGKGHLFSYAPSDFVNKQPDGQSTIDVPRLSRGFLTLRRLTYTRMKDTLYKQVEQGEYPGPEGLEKRFRALFDEVFADRNDKGLPERMYKLYWWLLLAYKAHFRLVTPEQVTAYFTVTRPLSPGVDVAGMVKQVASLVGKGAGKCILELCNDRRPKRRAYEAKRKEIMARVDGRSWLAFHGSRGENWHSILQTGVQVLSNTRHMLNGAAYGSGVYTSNVYATSQGYSVANEVPVAIVEVCTLPPISGPNHIVAVPDATCVCIKYLVVVNYQD